jgi:putative transposase
MNSIMRKKAKHKNHIWSWDFIHVSDDHNRALKWLVIIDEYTHECLALEVARSIKADDLIDVLADLFLQRGLPKYIRSDNGPEFVSKKIQKYLQLAKIKTLYVKKGSPWDCYSFWGYVESFNNILRDELLNTEIFLDVPDAKAHVRRWRNKYNHHHPHSSLGYVPPAIFSLSCLETIPLGGRGLASLTLAPCPLNTT